MKLANLNGQPEIFYALQGEGPNRGKPCIFIRLSHCNLHCVWCDTDYTWNWDTTTFRHWNDSDPTYRKYSEEQLVVEQTTRELVERIVPIGCHYIDITGGEPFMQQDELVELLVALRNLIPNCHVEIETNGTYKPNDEIDDLIHQYNVSPKLGSSGNNASAAIKASTLSFFASCNKAFFKFVITTPQDVSEVVQITNAYSIPKKRIYLVPVGADLDSMHAGQQWLPDLCLTHGFAYCDRLNIHLHGNKRGT